MILNHGGAVAEVYFLAEPEERSEKTVKNLPEQPSGTMRRYLLEALIALELLMSFSFLGYFHIEPISVTLAYVPVLLAGVLIGPLRAMAVGTVFGLASMWKASASYVMKADQLFSPLLSGKPMESLFLSVGSRMLFGLAVGLLYAAARRQRHCDLWIGVVSYFGRSIHSLLVYSAMSLFFPETGYGPANTFTELLRPTNIMINLATAGFVLLLWRLTRSLMWQKAQQRLEFAQGFQRGEPYRWLTIVVVILLTLGASLAITFYFVHRINYVLEGKGIILSGTGYSDVLHLQIQFLFGILSMMVLVILFLIVSSAYRDYEGKWDSLTGVMTRRAFFSSCNQAQQASDRGEHNRGYFIMVDLDYFKEINDSYGHPAGDRALKEVARNLKDIFGRQSFIGRLGGDESAVLVYTDMTAAELGSELRHFLDRVHRVTLENQHLTCSIGALPVRPLQPPEELYRDADLLLYTAKDQGRDRYVIGSAEPAGIEEA